MIEQRRFGRAEKVAQRSAMVRPKKPEPTTVLAFVAHYVGVSLATYSLR